jgi:hypothetical protein
MQTRSFQLNRTLGSSIGSVITGLEPDAGRPRRANVKSGASANAGGNPCILSEHPFGRQEKLFGSWRPDAAVAVWLQAGRLRALQVGTDIGFSDAASVGHPGMLACSPLFLDRGPSLKPSEIRGIG